MGHGRSLGNGGFNNTIPLVPEHHEVDWGLGWLVQDCAHTCCTSLWAAPVCSVRYVPRPACRNALMGNFLEHGSN
jgi:hypothetical protein